MKTKIAFIAMVLFLNGVGVHPPVAHAAGISDLLGGIFKKAEASAGQVTVTASYTAEDLFAKIVELQTINPAAYDVQIKGKGFKVSGEVERITRLSVEARNSSGGTTRGEYYAVKFKNCNISALFDLGRGQEVASIQIGQEISVIGRVGAAERKDILAVALFGAQIVTEKDALIQQSVPPGGKK